MENKKRLIDANSIQYHKTTECHGHGLYFAEQIAYKEEIERIPAVDAVEVVRCKNCKKWDPKTETCEEFTSQRLPIGGRVAFLTRETDFCSYGERRT